MKEELKETFAPVSRRWFLGFAGLAGASLVLPSCNRDDDDDPEPADGRIDFGSGDNGILNYTFALKQLEAAFYEKICSSFYPDITELEAKIMREIRDHKIAHRELLRNLLKDNVITGVEFDFSPVDFTSRSTVLTAARNLENVGVSALNGVVHLLITTQYVATILKMVSVDARHAAYISDNTGYNSFAATTDENGMEISLTPDGVLARIEYFKSVFTTKRLPKS